MLRTSHLIGLLVALSLALAACSSDSDDSDALSSSSSTEAEAPETTATVDEQDAPETSEPVNLELPEGYEGYVSELYSQPDLWMCHPDNENNVCARDLDYTVVNADGTTEIVEHVPSDGSVACYYMPPTSSGDPGPGADFEPGETEEIDALLNQAARFSSVCEVYAPITRQTTVASLVDLSIRTPESGQDKDADAIDAFQHFIANELGDRPFVLLGHSQGATSLRRIIAREVEPNDLLSSRMLSAVLLGTNVDVPDDEDIGGIFDRFPICREAGQINCIISYSTYGEEAPPGGPEGGQFGITLGSRVACANPAALSGGSAPLDAQFRTSDALEEALGQDIETPFVSLPGALNGECVQIELFDVLLVSFADPSNESITAALKATATSQWGEPFIGNGSVEDPYTVPSTFGLHVLDSNVAMGDLVAAVGDQIGTYQEQMG